MKPTKIQFTKQQILDLAREEPHFTDFLRQFKITEGVNPDSITYIDDHNSDMESCSSVILILRLKDGKLKKHPNATQNGSTHLPIWFIPGIESGYWRARSKNPLFVKNDGKVHLSTMATGVTLRQHELPDFTDVLEKDEVYILESYDDDQFEAHVSLSVPELVNLV